MTKRQATVGRGARASGGVTGADAGAAAGVEAEPRREEYTFYLDAALVERARREVGEPDVIRSIEAALAAALDYQLWVREVASGGRDILA